MVHRCICFGLLCVSLLLIFVLLAGFHLQDVQDIVVGFTRPIWGYTDKPTFTYELSNNGFETPGVSCPEMGWRARHGTVGKLYDTFIFATELDLLEIRLQELDGLVDAWVLVESDRTHTNKPKKLWWNTQGRHEPRFQPYLNRIESIVVRGSAIDRSHTFLRAGVFGLEAYQRRAIMKGLRRRGIQDGDVFITGDVDEIPNRATAQFLTQCDLFPQDLTLHMPTYIGGFQFKSYEEDKRHTKARMYRHTRRHPKWFSHHEQIGDVLILNAGWHCSWCFKTMDQFRFKMNGGVHYDRSNNKIGSWGYITDDVINDRLSKGEPPLERQYARPESYTFAEVWRRWWSKWDVEGRRFDANEIDMLPLALKKSPGKEFLYLKPGSSCRRGTG